jgi:hypothetical protein
MEPVAGRAGWCVMGIEKLNSAAWAAGFAMAPPEDSFEEAGSAVKTVTTQWRPGEAVMVREPSIDRSDWLKALFGLFGRRAPVSPA